MTDRLYRSRKKRVIGGVAGGLGDYLNIDPVIIRILAVVLTLFNGVGLLVYIIMWIVVPEEPYETQFEKSSSSEEKSEEETIKSSGKIEKSRKSRTIFGGFLIILGLIFLGERYIPAFDFVDIVPFAFILLGIGLLWNSFTKQNYE